MIINYNGPVYKQIIDASKKPVKAPTKQKESEDKQIVAKDKKEPVKASRKSKAKTKKED